MSVPTLTLPASGTTWAQFQAGGLAAQLERLIAAIVAITPTTAPTVAATLSSNAGGTVGGLLAPGVYYVNFTETNGIGETTISAESGPITVAVQAAPTGTPTVVVSGSGGDADSRGLLRRSYLRRLEPERGRRLWRDDRRHGVHVHADRHGRTGHHV